MGTGRFLILPLFALALLGCGRPAPGGEGASKTLREPDTGGFERAYAPKPFSFPATMVHLALTDVAVGV